MTSEAPTICATGCFCGFEAWYGINLTGPWQTKEQAWDRMFLHALEFRGVGLHV